MFISVTHLIYLFMRSHLITLRFGVSEQLVSDARSSAHKSEVMNKGEEPKRLRLSEHEERGRAFHGDLMYGRQRLASRTPNWPLPDCDGQVCGAGEQQADSRDAYLRITLLTMCDG